MVKNRYLPFGYQIKNGVLTLHAEEERLVRLIFQRYLAGATMKDIAKELNTQPIRYRENALKWDEHMIFRIMKKKEYTGTGKYPAILSAETFEKAAAICETKSYNRNADLTIIRKIVVCPQCGSRLYRNSKKPSVVLWQCRECGLDCGPIPDKELIGQVVTALNRAIANVEAFKPPHDPDNRLSLQVSRLTNEINRELERPQAEAEKLLDLILECAAEKYAVCSLGELDPATAQVKAALETHPPLESFDAALFHAVVKEVVIQPDGLVRLRYRNGQLLES